MPPGGVLPKLGALRGRRSPKSKQTQRGKLQVQQIEWVSFVMPFFFCELNAKTRRKLLAFQFRLWIVWAGGRVPRGTAFLSAVRDTLAMGEET